MGRRSKEPQVTGATLKVVRCLMSAPSAEWYGLEMMRLTHLSSGTLYPLLDRLEEWQLLESRWEDVDASEAKRPRRRLYRLTGSGREWASALHGEFLGAAPLIWAPTS